MLELLKNRLFILFIVGILVMIGLLQFVNDTDQHPCAPGQFPARCYRIERDICETTWTKVKADCDLKIKELNLPLTRLTGPIEFNCQAVKLDHAFSFLRITNDDCDEQHEKLEKWKKTNPDF